MDVKKLVDVLRATLSPDQQQQAEQQLNEVHKIIGFAPVLLQVVMSDQLDMPVRQAGVIYLKNMVSQFWQEREVEHAGDPVPFNIHEQDRAAIRDNIVEAIMQSPEPIRVQLTVCISNIIKHDYPGRWVSVPGPPPRVGLAEKLAMYLEQQDRQYWLGSLLCLYQLVKNYEYRLPEERAPINAAMSHLLPLIHRICSDLMPETDEASVLIQKQILKIFQALTQYFLQTDLITNQVFTQWMELIHRIVDRPIPEVANTVDEEERPELAWWKVKKWALHILVRVFERYGSPGNVLKQYKEFSEWYLKSFSGGIIQVLLKLLDQYRNGIYVSPRVLQQALNYIEQAISHSFSWKFIKGHVMSIIQDVVYPVMCHTDQDDELWETDPHEYIRLKYDVFEDFISPVTAAQTLLHSAVTKRKDVLPKTMGFCMQKLTAPETEPKKKDGALHMIGAVGDVLLKKKIYKDQMELMIQNHVFPEFQSPHGFLRARACWVLHHFSEVKFKNMDTLAQAIELTRQCLCGDKDLPVRVEAAIALQMMITSQEKAKGFIKPHVRPVIQELLNIIRETENDDLTGVMQKLVCTYVEEVMPIAVEMTHHLATTFQQVLESDTDCSDEKAITAMGLLNTIETILTVMEDQKEILSHLEGIVLNVIGIILQQNVLEFYEEVLSLIYSLTCQSVSHHMWQVFFMIYEMFQKDGFDYFTDMMPALHNYITVDSAAFLSNPKHLEIIYNMCKAVMTGDAGEDAECHAAKLLEVILLQCRGQVDPVVSSFVELALERLLFREVRTSELRTMCLQVVISALYYNPPLLLDILEKMHLPNTNETVTMSFLKQWIQDTDCFSGLHDRKIAVLGLCALMSTPNNRPTAINAVAPQIVPSALMLFSGLKRAYASRAAEDNSDDEGDEDGEYEENALDSDEDDIDEDGVEYLEKLEKAAGEDNSDDELSDDGLEETALESYQTPLDEDDCQIDEYQIFKSIIESLQTSDPEFYRALTAPLNSDQSEEIQDVFKLADQRKAAQESKRIEQLGGYQFTQVHVPTTFNFGS